MVHKLIKNDNYLLIVDESEIKKGKTFLTKEGIIHTNIGWNYGDKVIIAHLPLNGSPFLHGVDLLPPYHQEDDVEQLAEKYPYGGREGSRRYAFIDGYNKAREKYKLTLDKLIDLYVNETGYGMDMWSKEENETMSTIAKIIQSLNQYPTEFVLETEPYTVGEMSRMPLGTVNQKPKTITTAQGIQWVGKYK